MFNDNKGLSNIILSSVQKELTLWLTNKKSLENNWRDFLYSVISTYAQITKYFFDLHYYKYPFCFWQKMWFAKSNQSSSKKIMVWYILNWISSDVSFLNLKCNFEWHSASISNFKISDFCEKLSQSLFLC